jgi:hypothetical protein
MEPFAIARIESAIEDLRRIVQTIKKLPNAERQLHPLSTNHTSDIASAAGRLWKVLEKQSPIVLIELCDRLNCEPELVTLRCLAELISKRGNAFSRPWVLDVDWTTLDDLASDIGVAADKVAGMVAAAKQTDKPLKPRKGPGRAPIYDRIKDAKLKEDWEAARACGAKQKEFCAGRGITLEDLTGALRRIRERRGRSIAKAKGPTGKRRNPRVK